MGDPRDTLHWPEGWTTGDLPTECGPDQLNKLAIWMEAMYNWGKHVRKDIQRLEQATGIGPGDPGDPPTPPWKPKG